MRVSMRAEIMVLSSAAKINEFLFLALFGSSDPWCQHFRSSSLSTRYSTDTVGLVTTWQSDYTISNGRVSAACYLVAAKQILVKDIVSFAYGPRRQGCCSGDQEHLRISTFTLILLTFADRRSALP